MSGITARLVPSPFLRLLGLQVAVEHLYDIGADGGEEFPGVEGSAGGKGEMTTVGVRRNDQTLVRSEGIPGTM